MATLQDTVHEVVAAMVDNNELFTALDVSNKVKQTLPRAKHREVRDEVRAIYVSWLEFQSYGRTPIDVIIEDGSTQQALLYHPRHLAWDLDNQYDQQKRGQVSIKAAVPVGVPTTIATPVVGNPPSTWRGALPPTTPHKSSNSGSATLTVSATTTVSMPTARDLWKQLFATQPSMFPTK